MNEQQWLLPEFEPQIAHMRPQAELDAGWEERLLEDLKSGPITTCLPGFTGSICERLMASGQVTREETGFMEPGDPTGMEENGKIVTPKRAKTIIKEYWCNPFPQFRYSLK